MAQMLADNLNKRTDTSNEIDGSKSPPFYSAKGGLSHENEIVPKASDDLSMSSSNKKFRTAENRSTHQTPTPVRVRSTNPSFV